MEERLGELVRFAESYRDGEILVKKAMAYIDGGFDDEPVTRMLLLLSDPRAETWDLEPLRALHHALARHATVLDLPSVSESLIGESEPEAAEVFGVS